MKHLFTLLALSFVLTTASAQKIKNKKEYYDNGQIKSEGKWDHTPGFITNRERGEWKYYYSSGQLKAIEKYTDRGYPTGEWRSYWENDQLQSIENYKYVNNTRTWKYYHDNGQLKKSVTYLDGRIVGLVKEYDKSGNVVSTKDYDFENGLEDYSLGNYDRALLLFNKSASRGHDEAQYFLGEMYIYGTGVDQSTEKAIEWFNKSAENGNADAQYNLAVFYYNGQGVAKNTSYGVNWFKKSAERGNDEAQYFLAYAYEFGDVVEKNLSKAANWYQKSAEQGNADAQFKLGAFYFNGTGVTKNATIAFKWLLKAAKNGKSDAYYFIGNSYDTGNGVAQDTEQAIYWYKKAIAANPQMSEAYYNLGAIFFNKGAELYTQANNVPIEESKKYDELKAKANIELVKAVPYFEKCLELKPNDEATKGVLKQLHDILK